MTDQPDLRAAVAAGVVGSEESFRALLSAIVEVARSIFGATASSILLLDEETEELVFEAVVGEGEDTLLGTRFPAGTGIAGWVLATRTPLVIEDVQQRPALRERRGRGHGLRPEGAHGGSAAARGGSARRPLGARPPGADALQPAGDGAPRPLREPGRDRGRPPPQGARGRARSSARAAATSTSSRASRPRSTRSRTSSARPGLKLLDDLARHARRVAHEKERPRAAVSPARPRSEPRRRCSLQNRPERHRPGPRNVSPCDGRLLGVGPCGGPRRRALRSVPGGRP